MKEEVKWVAINLFDDEDATEEFIYQDRILKVSRIAKRQLIYWEYWHEILDMTYFEDYTIFNTHHINIQVKEVYPAVGKETPNKKL